MARPHHFRRVNKGNLRYARDDRNGIGHITRFKLNPGNVGERSDKLVGQTSLPVDDARASFARAPHLLLVALRLDAHKESVVARGARLDRQRRLSHCFQAGSPAIIVPKL